MVIFERKQHSGCTFIRSLETPGFRGRHQWTEGGLTSKPNQLMPFKATTLLSVPIRLGPRTVMGVSLLDPAAKGVRAADSAAACRPLRTMMHLRPFWYTCSGSSCAPTRRNGRRCECRRTILALQATVPHTGSYLMRRVQPQILLCATKLQRCACHNIIVCLLHPFSTCTHGSML